LEVILDREQGLPYEYRLLANGAGPRIRDGLSKTPKEIQLAWKRHTEE
jgi:hypothetical protein